MRFQNPHLTAIARTGLSAPARWLDENDLLHGRVLDYGCGRGADATLLGIEGYDPHFYSTFPVGKFDVIMCNYVLNVVSPRMGFGILEVIEGLLRPNGSAYVSVRRDIGETDSQRNVTLPLPVLVENAGFCIYELWR